MLSVGKNKKTFVYNLWVTVSKFANKLINTSLFTLHLTSYRGANDLSSKQFQVSQRTQVLLLPATCHINSTAENQMFHSIHCSMKKKKQIWSCKAGDDSTQPALPALLPPDIHSPRPPEMRPLTKSGCWIDMWPFFCPFLKSETVNWAVGLKWACGFKNQVFSVIDSQAEEFQQLPVLRFNEVSWPLSAVVLELRVGAQREEVAERNTT